MAFCHKISALSRILFRISICVYFLNGTVIYQIGNAVRGMGSLTDGGGVVAKHLKSEILS